MNYNVAYDTETNVSLAGETYEEVVYEGEVSYTTTIGEDTIIVYSK